MLCTGGSVFLQVLFCPNKAVMFIIPQVSLHKVFLGIFNAFSYIPDIYAPSQPAPLAINLLGVDQQEH